MDSVKALARSVGLAGFHPGTRLATSSSRARHCYGQPDVSWENSRWKEQDYLDRHERWRLLENATSRIPSLPKNDLTAARLFEIATILTQTFTADTAPISDLSGLSRLRFDAKAMLGLKLFALRPLSGLETLSPIDDLGTLEGLKPDEIVFFADMFQRLAGDFHRLLPSSANLLFTPSPANPFRVRIKLTADDPRTLTDERFVTFYEQLAFHKLPGIFDVFGPHSLKDAFLGYFDQAAFRTSGPIFPQFPQLEAQRTLLTAKMESRGLGEDGGAIVFDCEAKEHPMMAQIFKRIDHSGKRVQWDGKVTLVRDKEGTRLEIHWRQPWGMDRGPKKLWSGSDEFPEITEMFDRIAKTPFGSKVDLDLTPLERFARPSIKREKTLPLSDEVVQRERAKVIRNEAGVIDPDATESYQKIVAWFTPYEKGGGLGSVYLKNFVTEYNKVKGRLDADSQRFVAFSIYYYVCHSLPRGQVGDLEGLTEIFSLLEHPIFLQPEEAEWARFFFEHMTKEEIAHFAYASTPDNDFNCDLIKRPIRDLAADFAAHHVIVAPYRPDMPMKYRELLALDMTDTITPNQQLLLKEYALELMQAILPDIKVDETVLNRFYQLKELLYIMNGGNDQIGRVEPTLGAGIARSLELTVGQELPALRLTLPGNGLKLLEEATANDPEGSRRFDPTRALPEGKPS
jgi:hypothetical protein